MKLLKFTLIFLFLCTLYSFSNLKNEILSCYISFNEALNLSMNKSERLPAGSEKIRKLPTENGEVEISRIDGYRILYLNKKKAPFINLKVELSNPEKYNTDTAKILENLKYLNSQSADMETRDLIKLNYNGFTIYGLNRNSISAGSILGSFVMFPGNNTTIFFDFNNLKPEYRNFESLTDYKGQRNQFFGEYTSHLNNCTKSRF